MRAGCTAIFHRLQPLFSTTLVPLFPDPRRQLFHRLSTRLSMDMPAPMKAPAISLKFEH
jgi:hypothetical protein